MVKDKGKIILGYSGFILFEECYEYNEDACYIAESKESATQFMIDVGYNKSDFRIDKISMVHLINDFGCSSGEYAMEQLVFEKFEKGADERGLKFKYENFYLDPNLKIVYL